MGSSNIREAVLKLRNHINFWCAENAPDLDPAEVLSSLVKKENMESAISVLRKRIGRENELAMDKRLEMQKCICSARGICPSCEKIDAIDTEMEKMGLLKTGEEGKARGTDDPYCKWLDDSAKKTLDHKKQALIDASRIISSSLR